MITAADLSQVPLFSAVEGSERLRLARKTADIRLSPGEWATREGEERRFFVVLEGTLKSLKDIVGQSHLLGQSQTGTSFGETPISSAPPRSFPPARSRPAASPASSANSFRNSFATRPPPAKWSFSSCPAASRRRSRSPARLLPPASRSSAPGTTSTAVPSAASPVPTASSSIGRPTPKRLEELTVTVDGREPLTNPTVRQLAEALGLNTVPKHNRYDVIIAGAGPAGMAAAVYGASEGLNVLVVERSSPGQAGTPSRIETTSASPPRSPATTSPNAASAKAAWPSPSSTSTSPSEHP